MSFTAELLLVLSATPALLCGAIALLLWRRRVEVPGAAVGAVLNLAMSMWAGALTVQLAGRDLATVVLGRNLSYLGSELLTPAWLLFALQYTQAHRRITRRLVAALLVMPALTLLAVWTNSLHHLVRDNLRLIEAGGLTLVEAERGPWFWIDVAYGYTVLALGAGILLRAFLKYPDAYRGQIAAVLAAAGAPLATNALFMAGLFDVAGVDGIDPTPIAFTVSGAAIAAALLRFRLLDLLPVAHDAVLDSMRDAVVVLDRRGRVVELNPTAEVLLGADRRAAVGKSADQVLAGWPELAALCRSDREIEAELTRVDGGEPRWHDARLGHLHGRFGARSGTLLVLRDVTERRRLERTLEEMAFHDQLTGLPNRRLLFERVDQLLGDAAARRLQLGVLYLDLDGFKPINDRWGHEIGDRALIHVAGCLRRAVRDDDLVARLGGDEFAVVLVGAGGGELEAIADRVVAQLSRPFECGGIELQLGVSAGLAVFPEHGETWRRLLAAADAAMYQAKAQGGGLVAGTAPI